MTHTRMSDLHSPIKRLAIVVSLAVSCATPAAAQVRARLNELGTQGAFETGRYTPDATEDQSMLNFKLYYGRFLSDRVEIGPVLDIFKFEGTPASGSYGGFIDFHFGETARPFVPYLQGAAGQFFGESAKPVYFAVGPGLKWFFGEGGALNVNGVYRHQRFPEEIRNSTFTGYNDIVITVGAAIYFGR
jgi:hypothetical protein